MMQKDNASERRDLIPPLTCRIPPLTCSLPQVEVVNFYSVHNKHPTTNTTSTPPTLYTHGPVMYTIKYSMGQWEGGGGRIIIICATHKDYDLAAMMIFSWHWTAFVTLLKFWKVLKQLRAGKHFCISDQNRWWLLRNIWRRLDLLSMLASAFFYSCRLPSREISSLWMKTTKILMISNI